ncbi:MAG TPA: hypothetical protein VKQ71_01070 [Acidimicrobiales bacterium]|nr:hypothetical protein [Acidimicrobiales bacterium]
MFGPAEPVCATTIPNVTDVAVTPGALAVLAAAVDPDDPATVVPVFADPDLVLLLQAATANATATPNDTANRPRTTTPSRPRDAATTPRPATIRNLLHYSQEGVVAITIISFSKAIARDPRRSSGSPPRHHSPGLVELSSRSCDDL